MIAQIIGWSARNTLLVLIATFMAVAGGIYALKHPPGRHPRPVGRTGHHHDRVPGPESAGRR